MHSTKLIIAKMPANGAKFTGLVVSHAGQAVGGEALFTVGWYVAGQRVTLRGATDAANLATEVAAILANTTADRLKIASQDEASARAVIAMLTARERRRGLLTNSKIRRMTERAAALGIVTQPLEVPFPMVGITYRANDLEDLAILRA